MFEKMFGFLFELFCENINSILLMQCMHENPLHTQVIILSGKEMPGF